jgi:hypothetical protein
LQAIGFQLRPDSLEARGSKLEAALSNGPVF